MKKGIKSFFSSVFFGVLSYSLYLLIESSEEEFLTKGGFPVILILILYLLFYVFLSTFIISTIKFVLSPKSIKPIGVKGIKNFMIVFGTIFFLLAFLESIILIIIGDLQTLFSPLIIWSFWICFLMGFFFGLKKELKY